MTCDPKKMAPAVYKRWMAARVKHGAYANGGETAEHYIWRTMIARCHSPKSKDYARYGGRGIIVCERWRQDYAAFLEDMGPRPEGKSLDRKDNDGPYSPKNCRWATASEQQKNKRNTKRYIHAGVVKTVSEWSAHLGISTALACWRMRTHGTFEKGKTWQLQNQG